jgi:hypothetical protein
MKKTTFWPATLPPKENQKTGVTKNRGQVSQSVIKELQLSKKTKKPGSGLPKRQ